MSKKDNYYGVEPTHILHSSLFHPLLRTWQTRCTKPSKDNLIYPLFVTDAHNQVEEIGSLPGQKRYSVDTLVDNLTTLVDKGLKSVILFGVISNLSKTEDALNADSEENPVVRCLPLLREAFPHLLICCDVCICAYTSHGHCGIFSKDESSGEMFIDNSKSIKRLAEMSLVFAQKGAHVVAPSDMMDGRVGAIKGILARHNLSSRVNVMAYSAKFASCFYGPFRDAAKSAPSFGDRSTYQLPPTSHGIPLRALQRDVNEGADIIMIKPGMPYLDVIRSARDRFPDYPISVYQVSGEYAMLIHAANAGTFDLTKAVFESLFSFHRAGADIIITYFVPFLLDKL